jgi:anti-sigma-K factor RskA
MNDSIDSVHDLAAAYVMHAVDADEATAFEAHLAGCAECAADVQALRETAAMLGPVSSPPASLRTRVLARAAHTPQVGDRQVPELDARRSRRSVGAAWLAGVAAAAVLVAGGLGISAYQANQRAVETQIAAEQLSTLLSDPAATLQRVEVTGGGTVTLVVAPDGDRAAFVAAGLPGTAPSETYQLWAIDQAGATSVGLLQPEDGRATALLDLPPGTTIFGMSVEPAGGSEAPTTEPVVLVELET